jgi:hypothetical protein
MSQEMRDTADVAPSAVEVKKRFNLQKLCAVSCQSIDKAGRHFCLPTLRFSAV